MGAGVRVARVDEWPPGSHHGAHGEGAQVAAVACQRAHAWGYEDVWSHFGSDWGCGKVAGHERICRRLEVRVEL